MTFRSLVLSVAFALCCVSAPAQADKQLPGALDSKSASTAANSAVIGVNAATNEAAAKATAISTSSTGEPAASSNQTFRIERLQLSGGTELLTIFGRLDGIQSGSAASREVPLISVLRDTLSDSDPDNDRLRYVWMLSYTRPSLIKRVASAVPFLYQHIDNQTKASNGSPKPIIDLANSRRQMWNRFLWIGVQNIFLDSYGLPIKVSTRTYRRNASDYRAGHIFQALSILDSYERIRAHTRSENELLAFASPNAEKVGAATAIDDAPKSVMGLPAGFTPSEMLELRARLMLSSKAFGGLLGPEAYRSTVIKRVMSSVDNRGHNWELLRQRAEAEGLYFEPLVMPDGQPTHAIVWVAKSDLDAPRDRPFDDRFLNIENPWKDTRLRRQRGYSQTVYFDQDNRRVDATTPGAHAVEMIPLALYGLDHPKIPALLIDFRNSFNPKKREMSRRVFNDFAKDILSLSSFGNLPYFAGRRAYDFITGRRGMDLNQPTRLRSYSELKLMLYFNGTIDPKLRDEIEQRLQDVSLNPLNNDNNSEVALARQQYDALIRYAKRADGLPAKIDRDRRAEMMPLKHGAAGRIFFTAANILTFGRYVHREEATPELNARLEMARRLAHHTELLKQVAKSSPQAEVAWDIAIVKQSLNFLVANGSGADGSAAKAAAAIFQRTEDTEAQELCLEALSRINDKTARAELLRIYDQTPQPDLRAQVADRLRKAVTADPHIKASEVRTVLNQIGQQ
jgi:hypothetical protein